MIVVANRIAVARGYEEEFEKRFIERDFRLQELPGFIRTEVLRPIRADHYVVMTHWEDMESFENWTRSEHFKQAHAHRPPREMFREAPGSGLEIHEVFSSTEK